MRVVGVLPEVENPPGYILRFGDPVLRLEDHLGIVEQRLKTRIALQHRVGLDVLRFHPLHGTLAMRLFQPDKGVLSRRRGGG